MKRSALKRSGKPMAAGGLSAPTKAIKKLWEQLATEDCCVVCRTHLGVDDTPAEIHHIVEGGERLSHYMVIPLCPIHHRQGSAEHPSRHSVNGKYGGLDLFERTYGSERTLLEAAERTRGTDYSYNYQRDGFIHDEQNSTGDSDHPDTTADSKRTSGAGKSGMVEVPPMEMFSGQVRIHVMHHRYRLADFDNLNAKGAIDGLVTAGLLQDDSPKFVQGPIIHDQKKVKSYDDEKTVITLTEVAPTP